MLDELTSRFAQEQSGRYTNFIRDFAHGFQRSENAMYRWIIACVITASAAELRSGLRHVDIFSKTKKAHDRAGKLQLNSALQALKNTARLQQQKKVQPIILDFDENLNVLRVVDTGFILFLSKNRMEDLLAIIDMELKKGNNGGATDNLPGS